MEQEVRSFRDLIVWQRSIELCVAVYDFTRGLPKEELFGLRSQLQRAAVSVASNIAEGAGRRSTGEFIQFLGHANGSNNEVQTQLVIAARLGYGEEAAHRSCEGLSAEVGRMLNGLVASLGRRQRGVEQASNSPRSQTSGGELSIADH